MRKRTSPDDFIDEVISSKDLIESDLYVRTYVPIKMNIYTSVMCEQFFNKIKSRNYHL